MNSNHKIRKTYSFHRNTLSTAINAADMESKLYADPSRARRMYITVKKGNKNKVDNEEKEGIVVSMVEDIILAE